MGSHVFLWSGPQGGQISIGFDDEHFGLPQMRAEIDFMRAVHPELPDEVPRGTSFAFRKEESTGYLLARFRVGNNVYRNAEQGNLSRLWESAHYVARLWLPTRYERGPLGGVSRQEAYGTIYLPQETCRKGIRMRRLILVLAVVGTSVLLPSGVALAVTRVGGPDNDLILGADSEDVISGEDGNDELDGAHGADIMHGGDGSDKLSDGEEHAGAKDIRYGGDGDDILYPINKPAAPDLDLCGDGRDTVFADRTDFIADDCEKVKFGFPRPDEQPSG